MGSLYDMTTVVPRVFIEDATLMFDQSSLRGSGLLELGWQTAAVAQEWAEI